MATVSGLIVILMPTLWAVYSTFWISGDDSGCVGCARLAGGWTNGHAARNEWHGSAGPGSAEARSSYWLPRRAWQSDQSSLARRHRKRLEKGRFIWPSPADGVVGISASQLAYMLDGIDWRNPVPSDRSVRLLTLHFLGVSDQNL
jgi:hypothetical protein